MNIKNGSLLIFRLFGVNVFLHWSWAIVAVIQIYRMRDNLGLFSGNPHPIGYHIAFYLGLFLIVLIHEFGHALACKSVGGIAEQIILWPLGGVAFVQPPQRAGALLWSIAAGPLVNVILLPLTIVPAYYLWQTAVPGATGPDFLIDIAYLNAGLLIFNMLPFYPLDGGQILRALLWFICGRGLSLVIATIVGIIGAVALAALAAWVGGVWLGIMVAFMGMQSYRSMRAGFELYKMEKAPRRADAVCPMCRQHPPEIPIWRCPCGATFDTFQTAGVCPGCGQGFFTTACPFCQQSTPLGLWYPQAAQAATVATVPGLEFPPWKPSA